MLTQIAEDVGAAAINRRQRRAGMDRLVQTQFPRRRRESLIYEHVD